MCSSDLINDIHMEEVRKLILGCFIVILGHMAYWESISKCPHDIGKWLMAGWSIFVVFWIGLEMMSRGGCCLVVGVLIIAASVIGFYLVNPLLLIKIVSMQLSEEGTECLSKPVRYIDITYIYTANIVILSSIIGMLVYQVYRYKQRSKTNIIEKELTDFYSHDLLDPSFDINSFLERVRPVLESASDLKFKDKDREMLVKYCSREYMTDQADTPENDLALCAICMGAFQKYENLTDHPACKHVFHSECLDKWLNDKARVSRCPICKSVTRIKLFEHVIACRSETLHEMVDIEVPGCLTDKDDDGMTNK